MIISGPSGCGKSTFLINLTKNREWLIDQKIEEILWCYAEKASVPKYLENIRFHNGIPDNIENFDKKPILLILDDLMLNAYNSQICEIFTKGSHHRNISVILVTQNLFHKGSHTRDISLNAKYIVAFKNPRDKLQFQFLSRQIYPENPKDLLNVYKEITKEPHSYLLIDLTQAINESLRFRTDIFNKEYCICFCNVNENESEIETINGQQTYVIRA